LWDVSQRPRAGAAARKRPAAEEPVIPRDDRLEEEVLTAIQQQFGSFLKRPIKVTALPDGSIRLRGRVSYEEVKEQIERDVQIRFQIETRRVRTKRKIINEL